MTTFLPGGAFSGVTLSAQQLKAMDPDLNGVSNGVDIGYLMSVLSTKFRFVTSFTSSTPLSLGVTLVDSTSSPVSAAQTNVYFEVMWFKPLLLSK